MTYPWDGCFVHNMDNRPERYSMVKACLDRLEISHERFSAILTKDLHKYKENSKINTMTMGEKQNGCFLGHLLIWKEAYKRGLKSVLVFEDDIHTYISKDELLKTLEGLPDLDTFDILYLGKAMDKCLNYKHIEGTERIYENSEPLTAHAYMVTARGIKKLLKKKSYNFVIDVMLMKHCSSKYLKCITIHPSVFSQDVIIMSSTVRGMDKALSQIVECSDAYIVWIPAIGITVIVIIFILIIIVSLNYNRYRAYNS